jgi:hypothetical protein
MVRFVDRGAEFYLAHEWMNHKHPFRASAKPPTVFHGKGTATTEALNTLSDMSDLFQILLLITKPALWPGHGQSYLL